MREHATPVPHLFFFFFFLFVLHSYHFGTTRIRIFQKKKKERTIVSHFFFLQNQNPQNTFQYDRRKNNISTRFKLNVPKYQVWIFITRLYILYKTIPLLVYILVLNLDIYIYIHAYIYLYNSYIHASLHHQDASVRVARTRALAPLHTYTSIYDNTLAYTRNIPMNATNFHLELSRICRWASCIRRDDTRNAIRTPPFAPQQHDYYIHCLINRACV